METRYNGRLMQWLADAMVGSMVGEMVGAMVEEFRQAKIVRPKSTTEYCTPTRLFNGTRVCFLTQFSSLPGLPVEEVLVVTHSCWFA